MAQKKRGKHLFKWSRSDLPDNDEANTQVLLLGITRNETVPSQPIKSALKSKLKKRPISYPCESTLENAEAFADETALNANNFHLWNSIDHRRGIYQSIEHLNKTTGCFQLDRHKAKGDSKIRKSTTNEAYLVQPNSTENRFDGDDSKQTLAGAREEQQEKQQVNAIIGDTLKPNNSNETGAIERKTLYRWLYLSRKKQHDRREFSDDSNQKQNCRNNTTIVTRRRLSSSNSFKKPIKKLKPKSRLFSCIPYCVSTARNDSIPNSLASSSLRFGERGNSQKCNKSKSAKTKRIDIAPTNDLNENHFMLASNSCSNCSNSNKANNTIFNHNSNNNCSLFNNLNIMDRSVDSIGSCSLDVDAESTDFSDTSGSLNVCTPLSGKDFTREFTSRIHERSQIPIHNHQSALQQSQQQLQHQQTKTVLDPSSGKISTILSSSQITPPTIVSPTSPVKKPSYLNLACCVNGYSNLTTYNSKFRQSINKSREVSPIRPITHTVQYNRSGDNNYLGIPISVPINDNTKTYMMDAHTILSPEKRYFSAQTQQSSIELNGSNGRDCTDNINTNGCSTYFKSPNSTTVTSSFNGLTINRDPNLDYDSTTKTSSKSFIQQRVERLYGPTALTQGLYSPKKPKSADELQSNATKSTTTTATITSILVEKSQNSSNTFQSTKYVLEAQRNGHFNSLPSNQRPHNEENFNMDSLNEALPVLRHLRPEFRAQLPTLSPKRTIAISKLSSPAIPSTQYANGTTASGKLNECLTNNAKAQNNVDQQQQRQVTNGEKNEANNTCHSNIQTSKQPNNSVYNNVDSASTSIAPIDVKIASDITSKLSGDIENDYRHTHQQQQQQHESLAHGSANKNIESSDIINSSNNLHLNDPSTVKLESETNGRATDKINAQLDLTEMPSNSKDTKMSAVSVINTTKQDGSGEAFDANGNRKNEQIKDALYFLNTVHSERDRLLQLALNAETELEELLQKGGIDEDVLGHIRSAAGKARLLATKKFKQFEGLCNDCLNQVTGDMPPPTPKDLEGFWEMVLLQVDNVDSLYAELDKIRQSGWKKPQLVKPKQPQGAKLKKRPISASTTGGASNEAATAKKSAAAIAAAQKREAQRKQLLEMKRKNKIAMATTSDSNDLPVVANETSTAQQQSTNHSETDR